MTSPGQVAVQATDRSFYALRHPGAGGLDADGRGEWPADSFTFRLRDEGALALSAAEPALAAPTTAEPTKAAGSRTKE